MNQVLEQCKGKTIVDYQDNDYSPLVLVFDDGTELEIDIEAKYCDDAWLYVWFNENKKAPISGG